MKPILYSVLAVLFGYFCEAQDAATLSHSTATCNYNLSSPTAWSSTCNPAGISDIKKLSFCALFQNHFLLKDVSTQYICAAFPIKKTLSFSSSLYRFGNHFFSKNEWNNAIAIKLNEKLSSGIQLHTQYIYQSEERNRWQIFPEIGISYKIKEKITWSSSLQNFISNKISVDKKQTLRLGLSYCFDKKVKTHLQCIFNSGKYPVLAAAIDYQFNDKLYFGFNISSSAQPFHFGIAYQLQKIKTSIDFAYHQQLGFSPISSFSL
jgi:hypothetical protein